eukprot:2628183-Prorocentrum_lima.AAC.1
MVVLAAQLHAYHTDLVDMVAAGLPKTIAGHLWRVSAAAAPNHLFSCDLYSQTEAAALDAAQLTHITWLAERALPP